MSTSWAAVAAAGTCLCVATVPAAAHHAIGGTVDTSRTQQFDMVLTRVDWVNPHAWFHFAYTRPDGTVIRDVAVEWMGLNGLRRAGYSEESFAAGGTYRVTFHPNRDGSLGGFLVRMVDQATGAVIGRREAAPAAPARPAPPAPRPRVTNIAY
jgi:hypothetical protein